MDFNIFSLFTKPMKLVESAKINVGEENTEFYYIEYVYYGK